MESADLAWGGLLAVGAAFELWALVNHRQGDTLSERTRIWWRTHTRPGRALFLAAWSVFAVWFAFHIV